jgi:hypothetical protein
VRTRAHKNFPNLIKPVSHFQNESPIFHPPVFGEIIIGVNEKNVGYRFVPPLKPGIDVQIVGLFVVLNVGGEK